MRPALRAPEPATPRRWTKAHDALVCAHLHRDAIPRMVRESGLAFRDGCRDFVETLHQRAVPLLIFSAGLGGPHAARAARAATQ